MISRWNSFIDVIIDRNKTLIVVCRYLVMSLIDYVFMYLCINVFIDNKIDYWSIISKTKYSDRNLESSIWAASKRKKFAFNIFTLQETIIANYLIFWTTFSNRWDLKFILKTSFMIDFKRLFNDFDCLINEHFNLSRQLWCFWENANFISNRKLIALSFRRLNKDHASVDLSSSMKSQILKFASQYRT